MTTYEIGTYKVTWEVPTDDEYHTIAEYRNGRVLSFTHTRSDKVAASAFSNMCALHKARESYLTKNR